MTWAPGLPITIRDKLVLEGGWIERRGVTCFNLYRAPTIEPGDPAKAGPWIDHVRLIYPDEAEHIIDWLAHRVQRPQEKINHALVLGGQQGIGKDTLLEPVKYAIGPWNFQEVSPQQVLGRFNGFLKAVILRISEARDLGEFDRFKFYDHMKAYTAAPPDTLRVDEKNLREYAILNFCGVIITTNHKTDGIFLPADDRRHYVAWSGRTKDDPEFQNGYWPKPLCLVSRRRDAPRRGLPDAARHLRVRPQSAAAEDAGLLGDRRRQPRIRRGGAGRHPRSARQSPAVTLSRLVSMRGRRHRRLAEGSAKPPDYPAQAGAVRLCPGAQSDDARDGQWKINGKRQTVYARQTLSLRDQIAAAEALRLGWRR